MLEEARRGEGGDDDVERLKGIGCDEGKNDGYGPTERRTDGPTDRRTDRRTDTPSYRDARTHLKIIDINTFIMKHTFFVSISRNMQISPKPCFDTEQKASPSEFLLCTEIMAPYKSCDVVHQV